MWDLEGVKITADTITAAIATAVESGGDFLQLEYNEELVAKIVVSESGQVKFIPAEYNAISMALTDLLDQLYKQQHLA